MNSETMVTSQPSIDWKLSIKLANNNKDLARDLLEMFVSDLPRASDTIHHAFDAQQFDELLMQVHKLHGASCYCGVSRLKQILTNMESAVKQKHFSQFESQLEEYDDEVNNILSAYKLSDFN